MDAEARDLLLRTLIYEAELEEERLDNEASYRLIVEFLNQEPAFALGFEAGRVYAQMRAGADVIEGSYNAENDEQLLLMARKLGYEVDTEQEAEGWVRIRFYKPWCKGMWDEAEATDGE